MEKPDLTEEKNILEALDEAHEAFLKAKRLHPSEMDEWVYKIHKLQESVCYRIAAKSHPELIWSLNPEKQFNHLK